MTSQVPQERYIFSLAYLLCRAKSLFNTLSTNTLRDGHLRMDEIFFETPVFSLDYYYERTGRIWFYSIPLSLAYILVIGILKEKMKNVKPFDLKKYLAIWSALLAFFSIIGTYYVLPIFLNMITKHGFRHSICSKDANTHYLIKLWSYMFAWSKVFELGDTIFIVLRKQKLIFLHWYHHALTLIYCFLACKNLISVHVWMMTLNLFIHSIMYSYYSLKACNIFLPKSISMCITASQILQMIIGLLVSVYSSFSCENYTKLDVESSLIATLMYASYAVLFTNFFVKSYLMRTSKIK